jgi:hypothetical protein
VATAQDVNVLLRGVVYATEGTLTQGPTIVLGRFHLAPNQFFLDCLGNSHNVPRQDVNNESVTQTFCLQSCSPGYTLTRDAAAPLDLLRPPILPTAQVPLQHRRPSAAL